MVSLLIERYPSRKRVAYSGSRNRLQFLDDFNLLLKFGDGNTLLKETTVSEAETAHSVMSLAELGELDSLLQCICGKWFFALRKSQKSCSPTCRHKLYEQTPEAKAKRREYMKKYNRLKASGKVK